jgi:hypothetical protein
MLKISFKSDATFIEVMRTKGPRIIMVLTTKVTSLMLRLASYVQSQKLSGQVLTPRTGVLRGSVNAIPATVEGTTITGAVEAAGGPAFYGHFFEKGTSDESSMFWGGGRGYPIMAVKARALRFMIDGKVVFAKSVMHPPIIARPFMKPSLDENAANIESELRASVNEVINE